jgi:YVTN family beta-propeller protein
VALSRDDSLVYAVDPDLDSLFITSTKGDKTVTRIAVGRMPEKVLVGPDDTIYVANRYGRSVSVIRKGDTQVAATLDVGVEPVGLAITADGRTLYVVNSAMQNSLETGSVMAFDTATRAIRWESPVGPEPRGIALLPNGKAMVSLYKSGEMVVLDATNGKVLRNNTDVFQQLNQVELLRNGDRCNGLTCAGPVPSVDPTSGAFPNATTTRTRRPRALEAVLTNPEGTQVYVPTLLATDATLNTRPHDDKVSATVPGRSESGGYGSSGGCGVRTAVAAPGLLTFDIEGNATVDDVGTCTPGSTDRPPVILTSNVKGMPVQGPVAVATDPSGTFLFVANRESNNVSVVPTRTALEPLRSDREPFLRGQQVVPVGSGPTGIAVTADGKTAWVYNAFDHSLSRLEADQGLVRQREVRTLGQDVLPADVVAGRRLFFSATNPDMNDPKLGISCATCHVEAREDGHVWNTTEGPRNTPALTGKKLAETGPFHWNGEFDTVTQFMTHTTKDRMGGSGPTPAMERQLMAFIMSVPAPDNPFATSTPAAVLERGKAAFDKAACGSCHSGSTFTDNRFYDVGTLVKQGPVQDRNEFLFHGGLNTPSLLGIARTGPFLHDGSAPTLKARIMMGKSADKHGLTSGLTDQEVDDLVSYVQSL